MNRRDLASVVHGGPNDPLDGRSLGLSLGIHVVAFVVVLWVIPALRPDPILYEAVEIRVVSAPPASAPQPEEEVPPAPEEQLVVETPADPVEEEEAPVPDEEEAPAPEPEETPPPETEETPAPAEEPTPAEAEETEREGRTSTFAWKGCVGTIRPTTTTSSARSSGAFELPKRAIARPSSNS